MRYNKKFEHWLNIAQNRRLPSSYIWLYDIYISKWLESKELQLIQLENPRTLDEARKFVNFYGNRTWTALFWSADRRDRVQGDGPTGVTDYHYGQVTK